MWRFKADIPIFKLIPIAVVAFRFLLEWVEEVLPCDGAQNSDWLVAAWISLLLALCFARQGREEEGPGGSEEADTANEFKNSLWGAQKIRDSLVDLGFVKLDVGTIRKYMVKRSKDPSGNWLPFIKNHMDVSWAMDFCVVRTVGFRAYYVFVILEHGSRRIRHWNITESPSLEWIIQQLREATPYGEDPRFIHRDNDGLYGKGVSMFLKASGVEEVRSAFRSPWQNPYVERFFGSMRREILNHVIILNEKHLRPLLSEYAEWCENHRLHQGLGGRRPRAKQGGSANAGDGKIISIPVLGGLHHRYERCAA